MNNAATQPADALGEVADGYPKTISLSDQEVEIRVFGTQDRAQVLAFAQALPEQDLLFLRLDITEPDIVDAWLANISSGATFSLCAYAGGEFVGYATVERNPARWTRRVGEIRVNVAPSLRSQGLGRSLTSQIFDIARAMGLKKLVAHMTPDQAGAQVAFKRLGFVPEALLADHVEDRHGDAHDLLIMSYDVDGHSGHMDDPI